MGKQQRKDWKFKIEYRRRHRKWSKQFRINQGRYPSTEDHINYEVDVIIDEMDSTKIIKQTT